MRSIARSRAFAATHAIVEALWVVPEKFDVLTKLHPRVQWIVRTHSQAPFLASEGIATAWIAGYLKRGIEIMCNSAEAQAEIKAMATDFGHSESLVSLRAQFLSDPRPIRSEAASAGGQRRGAYRLLRRDPAVEEPPGSGNRRNLVR